MAKSAITKEIRLLKTLIFILGFLNIFLIGYLIFLPLYPLLKYQLRQLSFIYKQNYNKISKNQKDDNSINPPVSQIQTEKIVNSPNRVIIEKIGVDVPIAEAPEAESKKALSQGAWHLPQTSTPEKGSNTVISAHRFKYLPPNNLTFYLLDKLVAGDIVSVIWEHKEYNYKIKESKIVLPTEISILDPTAKPILTLFTCDPIWSEKNRLVVIGELIE